MVAISNAGANVRCVGSSMAVPSNLECARSAMYERQQRSKVASRILGK